MVNHNKTPKFLRRFILNRKGTAEVIGSVLFIMILLFAFTNIYLWHDNATKTMNNLFSDKLNSQIAVRWELTQAGVETNTLVVTNGGGVGTSISRLWIVRGGSDHLYAHFENAQGVGLILPPGGTIKLELSGSDYTSPIDFTTSGGITHVSYTPNKAVDTFTVLTTLGNMASPKGQIVIVDSNGGGEGGNQAIGDFIPDYHSIQWRDASGSWTSGWSIPVIRNNHVMWKVDVTYYGASTITVDKNSYIFISPLNAQQGQGHPPQKFYLVDADLSPSEGVTVASSSEGTEITLYFASVTPGGTASGITLDRSNGDEFLMSLIIYGAPPSTYAQSFPLYAIRIQP
jgi:hypothetical protein